MDRMTSPLSIHFMNFVQTKNKNKFQQSNTSIMKEEKKLKTTAR
jgi:hypothetical protein